ncbi:MAG: tol-pal system-associated acyl-CoA thioesterase [Devosia sp.]
MTGHSHRIEVRVYYEDTDFSGAVYHAAYLHFFERGRTEFLRAEGVHHSELARDGLAFAVRSMTIEFVRAAHIDDLLTVETRIAEISGARMTLEQSIQRGGELIASARVVVAAVKHGRAARLPAALLAAFRR